MTKLVRLSAENSFPLFGPPKSLLTNPEGSSGYGLHGDNNAYALGMSDWFMRGLDNGLQDNY